MIVEMCYTGWQNEKDGGEEKVKRQRQETIITHNIPFTADTSTFISLTNNYSDLWEKSMTNAADELKDAQRVQ